MRVVDVRADRYLKSADAADFGRAADVLVVQVDTHLVPKNFGTRCTKRAQSGGGPALLDEGVVSRELTGQSRRLALQSRRERRMIVVAMEAPAFWQKQERCSCVSS